jgi:uncharacterized protein DUF1844
MPEVQKTVQTGEMTQRFIEFVMMHAQNAALFLGQIPNPKTGEAEINLDLARMFIDQLEMVQEKTRGNLTNEEAMVLRNALSNLQMAYVELAGEAGGARPPGGPQTSAESEERESPQPTPSSQAAEQPGSSGSEQSPPVASSESETESRKKFSKSYGP